MKQKADKQLRKQYFEIGDMVYLQLQPYQLKSLAKWPNKNLALKYFGPFRILQRLGQVAYKLELPKGTSIHPVFYISKLRKAIGLSTQTQVLPSCFTDTMEWPLQLATVLAARQRTGQVEVFIQWQGLLEEDSSWEPRLTIRHQFPEFPLGDKVIVDEGDKDTVQMKYMTEGRDI